MIIIRLNKSKIAFIEKQKSPDNPISQPNFYTKILFQPFLILNQSKKKFHKRPLKNDYLSSKVEDLGEIWDQI